MVDARELVTKAVAGKRVSRKGWVRSNCPFCDWRHGSEDRSQSFGFHAVSLWYKCYRCGVRGKLRSAIDDLDVSRVLDAAVFQVQGVEPPEGYVPLVQVRKPLIYREAWDYIRTRNIPDALIEGLGIGATIEGWFAGRIIVPVFSFEGDWLWFVARAWNKRSPMRYLYPTGNREGVLFNRSALFVETEKPVLVVEGVFDALPHWPNAVACLGKPTEEQIEALVQARRPVVMALDGDAWEEAWAVSRRIGLRGKDACSIHLLPKTDPGVTTRKDLWDMALNAMESSVA